MITRGANAMPTSEGRRRTARQKVGWKPSFSKSRNRRPAAEKERRMTSGTKYARPSGGTWTVVPGTPPQDREHSDGEQGDCRGDPRCRDRPEAWSSRSVPPGDPPAESDERRQEEESEAEADEQQPPRSDVDVGQDRLAERGRIAEPIGEGPDDEDRREGDLAHPAGAGRPRTHQASDGDRPEDHQQEEIGREVVRDDQSARDQEQRCEGFRIRAEPEEQDQTRKHE